MPEQYRDSSGRLIGKSWTTPDGRTTYTDQSGGVTAREDYRGTTNASGGLISRQKVGPTTLPWKLDPNERRPDPRFLQQDYDGFSNGGDNVSYGNGMAFGGFIGQFGAVVLTFVSMFALCIAFGTILMVVFGVHDAWVWLQRPDQFWPFTSVNAYQDVVNVWNGMWGSLASGVDFVKGILNS